MIEWRFKQLLHEHGLSAYRVAQTANLAPNTVYALAREQPKRVDLETLEQLLVALEELTGKELSVSDLLVRYRR